MKKLTAFFMGLIMFLIAVFSVHFVSSKTMNMNNPKFGTWPSAYKDLSYDAVKANLRDNSLLVYGSSELHHGKKSLFHPMNLFKDNDIELMLIGSALNQSLSHTISLGAQEKNLKNRKVVLVVSPSWYVRGGATPEGYKLRFSRSNYTEFINNENISPELKNNIIKRNNELLGKNINRRGETILKEKERMALMAARSAGKIKRLDEYPKNLSHNEPEWNLLIEKAEAYSKEHSSNRFYMLDLAYNTKVKAVLKEKKNSSLKGNYGESLEYYDTELFLQLCKERGIKPLLIIQPINGYWYDYTGFPKEGREAFHNKILKLAKKYDASVADFWDRCYDKYFFEDAVHPAGKGWVLINEKIYEFYRKK